MGNIQFNAGHKIVFNNVLSNIGNGYNETTGIFTTPRNGRYTFTLVTMATGGEHYAQLRVNGVRQSVARGPAASGQVSGCSNTRRVPDFTIRGDEHGRLHMN